MKLQSIIYAECTLPTPSAPALAGLQENENLKTYALQSKCASGA